ncbi:MAG TPA: hypothetical protein DEQ64_17710 [Lachnoclostridium sp.]|jgi:signal transduction histidine kinase|uniref:sensor histidine kinase n=1 Tax=Lacrimispora sp. TaxID=2719234 RepID=UPI000EEE04BE|nr:HAMP domain-containing sensor histidine kinase [Lacrimispora sp.]HCD45526.1 hypothetical protein [Lachnoclostridium sp.]
MKKLKIRTKMMLWYTLLTGILLAVFLPVLYHTIAATLLDSEKNNIGATMSIAESSIEFDNGHLSIGDELKAPANTFIIIWDKSGQVIYANTQKNLFYTIQFTEGNPYRIYYNNEDWLVLDKTVQENNHVVKIRICSSIDKMEAVLNRTLFLMLVVIPLFLLITIIGGLFIAKRALRPISKITDLASEIGHGDLSKRITGIESMDEVGELANTFNEMLASLENSFEKEKRFSSDSSHELRTPVAIIMANAEAILAATPGADPTTAANTILAESHRMNTVISQLLMLTRGIEGKYQIQLEEVSLPVLTDAVLEQLQEEAASKVITLVNETADVTVQADQSLLTQMMLNLVGNAIKYGKPDGHVWVKAEREGDGCLITVSDDGIGIMPEELPLIFDRFYRADKSRDRSGSGLGLSIVKWIVDMHGGKIELESTPDQGSIFLIRM